MTPYDPEKVRAVEVAVLDSWMQYEENSLSGWCIHCNSDFQDNLSAGNSCDHSANRVVLVAIEMLALEVDL